MVDGPDLLTVTEEREHKREQVYSVCDIRDEFLRGSKLEIFACDDN